LIEAFHEIAQLYVKEGLAGSAKNYYQSILEIAPDDSKAIKALREIESLNHQGEELLPLRKRQNRPLQTFSSPERRPVAEDSDLPSSPAMDDSLVAPGPGSLPWIRTQRCTTT